METPSSTRRITRSQALAAFSNNKSNSASNSIPNGEISVTKSRERKSMLEDRNALVDITNDSPIVGVAMETPSSSIMKLKSSRVKMMTPGSGEALLRGQVKTLLQKVEEAAELSKLGLENRPFIRFVNSPMTLLAPTPANTPMVSNSASEDGNSLPSGMPSPVEEQLISQVVNDIFDGKNQESIESSLITRFLDFSEKSENSSDLSECSSVVTCLGGSAESDCKEQAALEKSPQDDDDDSSLWSIQVNASMNDEEEEEVIEEEGLDEAKEGDYYDVNNEDDEVDDEGLWMDELCDGISNVSMNEKRMVEFEGKHIRFVYNSDDEIIEEKEDRSETGSSSAPSIVRLNGLPTPEGKHLRFASEEEENSC